MQKKTLKNIEYLAASMPVIMKQTHEYHYVAGTELIEQGDTERDGKKIIPEHLYKQAMPVMIEVNHKRAIRKLLEKRGLNGVRDYCTAVKKHADKLKAEL